MFQIFSKKNPKPIQNLSESERVIVDEFLEDECKPSEISEKTGYNIVAIRRYVDLLRKRKEKADAKNPPIQNNTIREKEDELKILELEHKIAAKKERQALELEKLRLEIDEKKAELNGEFEINESMPEEMQWAQIAKDFLNIYQQNNSSPLHQAGGVPINEVTPQNNGATSTIQTPPAVSDIDLSDEDICKLLEEIKEKNPSYIEMAKNMPESVVINFVKSRYPYSDKTIKRAIEILKNPQKTLEVKK